jgi:hypothetical protein
MLSIEAKQRPKSSRISFIKRRKFWTAFLKPNDMKGNYKGNRCGNYSLKCFRDGQESDMPS